MRTDAASIYSVRQKTSCDIFTNDRSAALNSGIVLASVAACNKTPALIGLPKPDNSVNGGPANSEPLITGDEITAV